MALQISEKLLSEKARKELSKVSNKSQLLRDALEFYLDRDEILNYARHESSTKDSAKDELITSLIEEIKELKLIIQDVRLKGDVEIKASDESDNTTQSSNSAIQFSRIIEEKNENKEIHTDIDPNLSCYED